MKKILLTFVCLTLSFSSTLSAGASSNDLEVSGWIPYWTSKAPSAAQKKLSQLDMIHPFGYALKENGDLNDLMGVTKGSWKKLITSARANNVLVVPTITTSNGAIVHMLLSDTDARKDHINKILSTVKKQKFDGIDIDYEGKWSETIDYYSLFLKELKKGLGDKVLSCTIEARTPPSSLYRNIPDTIAYANDYNAINMYCDRVNIMAYDQQRADIRLNDLNKGAPYIPVSDVDWVREVLDFTLTSIDADKVVLGIPSYGHQYEVLVTPNQFTEYRRVGAYNIPSILKILKKEHATAGRTSAGELGFSYLGLGKHAPQYSADLPIPKNTSKSLIAAAQSLAYTNTTGNDSVFNYVTWSDAEAMIEKIDLAKEFDLLGIAFFKIDGQEDKAVWNEL